MAYLYLALGDSITAGYGVGPANSFASVYYRFLQRNLPGLHYQNFGINGLRSSDLTNWLAVDAGLAQRVAASSVITLTIGSNDLIHLLRVFAGDLAPVAPAADVQLKDNVARVAYYIRRLNSQALVQAAAIYNPFSARDYPAFRTGAQPVIDLANAALRSVCKEAGFAFVGADRAFCGQENLVLDPVHLHPNFHGHRVLAAAFAASTQAGHIG